MLYDRLKSYQRSLGFRIALWYSLTFLLGSFALLSLVYFMLARSLLAKEREVIKSEARELSNLFEKGGVDLVQAVFKPSRSQPNAAQFFVRVVDREGNLVFFRIPHELANLGLENSVILSPLLNREWQSVSNSQGEIEIHTTKLEKGFILQVGKSKALLEEVLEDFREIITTIGLILCGVSVGGGAIFANRSLRPLRNLVQDLGAVMDAGSISQRVTTSSSGDELEELATRLNKLLTRQANLIQGMREALDNVAHDLRTPLTRWRGMAELALQQEGDSNQAKEALAICLEESEQVLTMLNILMDISEAETGILKLNYESVNLNFLIQSAVELYQGLSEAKNITINYSSPNDCKLRADKNRLFQALSNLLDNAIKYTPAGGKVEVNLEQNSHDIILRVKDNGVGVSAKDLSHIWDRLYRAEQSRSERGLGLGLSLVRAIVAAHGGTATVRSELKIGTEFRVRLPLDPY